VDHCTLTIGDAAAAETATSAVVATIIPIKTATATTTAAIASA